MKRKVQAPSVSVSSGTLGSCEDTVCIGASIATIDFVHLDCLERKGSQYKGQFLLEVQSMDRL